MPEKNNLIECPTCGAPTEVWIEDIEDEFGDPSQLRLIKYRPPDSGDVEGREKILRDYISWKWGETVSVFKKYHPDWNAEDLEYVIESDLANYRAHFAAKTDV